MVEKRFAEVNENEKDRIVNSAIPKNTQRRHSLCWVFLIVSKQAKRAMVFRISEQVHMQSVLDFVDKQQCI